MRHFYTILNHCAMEESDWAMLEIDWGEGGGIKGGAMVGGQT